LASWINEALCSIHFMEYPDITVREKFGVVSDCVNVVFRGFSEGEVEALLKGLGWMPVLISHEAALAGGAPILEMQYAVLPEVVRYHIRLFKFGDEIVGNVHFNRLDPAKLRRLELHGSDHERGVQFLRRQLDGRGVCLEEGAGGKCRIVFVSKCF